MSYSNTFSYKIHALTFTVDYLANAVLRQNSDINFSQFLILLCFTENPGQTQKFAAKWLQHTEATVSYMVKRMTGKGYLEVEQDPIDRRNKVIHPTLKGSTLMANLYPLLEEALMSHVEKIPSTELNTMMTNMDLLMNSILSQSLE